MSKNTSSDNNDSSKRLEEPSVKLTEFDKFESAYLKIAEHLQHVKLPRSKELEVVPAERIEDPRDVDLLVDYIGNRKLRKKDIEKALEEELECEDMKQLGLLGNKIRECSNQKKTGSVVKQVLEMEKEEKKARASTEKTEEELDATKGIQSAKKTKKSKKKQKKRVDLRGKKEKKQAERREKRGQRKKVSKNPISE